MARLCKWNATKNPAMPVTRTTRPSMKRLSRSATTACPVGWRAALAASIAKRRIMAPQNSDPHSKVVRMKNSAGTGSACQNPSEPTWSAAVERSVACVGLG
jgi:hypothetical protein